MTRIDADKALQEGALTDKVIGAFYATYNELGWGFLESVYENALAIALAEAGIQIERQKAVPVWFRGQIIGDFRTDLIVEGRLILEIKSVQSLVPAHEAQLTNYLKATRIPLGLLLNFGPKPAFRRRVFTSSDPNLSVSSA